MSLLSFILTLLVLFRSRILAWLTFRKAKKKQAIKKALDEIESITSQPFDPLRFAKEAFEWLRLLLCNVAFVAFLVFSVTLMGRAMTDVSFTTPWMKTFNTLLYSIASVFLGFSIVSLSELRRKLNIKLDPQKAQKAIERLRTTLEKLD
ncbi:hypothetical protein [Xylella fastidiosa]|uniref:hypothetical protein n=1 Tax=Xylella fastidiosa TaxID=2371 RepID=UPI0003F896B8|nr:hypothetical protein [Xylella fastidiosa]